MGFMAGLADWIEGTGAIASKNHDPGEKILHRETIRVKFDGTRVASGELTNRNKIFDNLWNDEIFA